MLKIKTILLQLVCLICLVSVINVSFAKQIKYPPIKVGVLVPMQHQAMDEIVAGFKNTLQQTYPGKITFLIKNAQGDANLQRSILQQFKQQHVDLYAPIATQPTQMTLAMVYDKPIVGIAAEYTEAQRKHRVPCNVTVVDDEIAVATQLQFMRKVIPNLKQITLVHSPSDKITPEVADCIKYAKAHGFKIQDLMVQQLADLYMVSKQISADSQAIYILKDNMVASGIRTLIKQAEISHIPVITSDDGTVQHGAAFATGVKEYQIGVEGAKLAAVVLKGGKINEVPIKKLDKLLVFINPKAAARQGIDVAKIKQVTQKEGYQICTI
ncbi:MAG: ABC transporter substrate binding protein [Gammaproteobacteria bacterium]|jgi:putative ABC transport system substrate-binding protein